MTPDEIAALLAKASASPWSAQSVAATLAQDGCFVVGTKDCFALGRVVLDEAELLQIATNPDQQRRGLGTRVLAAFEDEARRRGCVRVFLEVAHCNEAAQALYTSSGWAVDGVRPNYYRQANGLREDAWLMSKTL